MRATCQDAGRSHLLCGMKDQNPPAPVVFHEVVEKRQKQKDRYQENAENDTDEVALMKSRYQQDGEQSDQNQTKGADTEQDHGHGALENTI